eukprot:5161639-Alexandrium_andersonii.AAC.1
MPPPLGQNADHDATQWRKRLAAAGGGARHPDMELIRPLRRRIMQGTEEAVEDDLMGPAPCLAKDPLPKTRT